MHEFLPLGGASEIGASCFYLNISGTGILLDCGIHPRKNGIEALPDFDKLYTVPLDYVFISHAHQDHLGSLPFLIQKFPHVIIYSTPQTKEIAAITLHNAASIIARSFPESSDIKIYTHDEIDLLVRSIRDENYSSEIILSGVTHNSKEPINAKLIDAGHILGSAAVYINHNGNKILYTGDINLSDQSIMKSADLSGIKNIDTLILETTYGATDSEKLGTWQTEQSRFIKSANKIINNGGSILIPVFALGKTQEMITMIAKSIKKGLLSDTNIYTGGVSKQISKAYDTNKYIVNRSEPDFEIKDVEQIDLSEVQDMNRFIKNPGIVLAASGMMIEGTTSFKLAGFWMRQKNFAVFCVGYMDSETPGYKIMNSRTGDKIQLGEFGEHQTINCPVEKFYFPSHSKREDLLNIVKLTNPKQVILIHGENDSHDWIGSNILNQFPHIKIHSAESGKKIII